MATENNFDKLRSKVHQGVPLDNQAPKPAPADTEVKSAGPGDALTVAENTPPEATQIPDVQSAKLVESPAKPTEKRKRKAQGDYQSVFFNRVDFSHRKPLYITAQTHRRLMRIVHLMDESKATISSYVENIILNHLDTFKEDIETIYQTNNINPTE